MGLVHCQGASAPEARTEILDGSSLHRAGRLHNFRPCRRTPTSNCYGAAEAPCCRRGRILVGGLCYGAAGAPPQYRCSSSGPCARLSPHQTLLIAPWPGTDWSCRASEWMPARHIAPAFAGLRHRHAGMDQADFCALTMESIFTPVLTKSTAENPTLSSASFTSPYV